MLLQKQHEISALEKELNESDNIEKNRLYLSSFKRDSNNARQAIFSKLKIAVKEYGEHQSRRGNGTRLTYAIR